MSVQGSHGDHCSSGDLAVLRLLAVSREEIQRDRIRLTNRVGAFERTSRAPTPAGFEPLAERLKAIEDSIDLMLRRTWRQHYLAPWAKTIKGIGAGSLIAQLIAVIGDPVVAQPMIGMRAPDGTWTVVPDGEPFERTLRQLWQYCGVGDPETKRRRGHTEGEARRAGNPKARTILFRIAGQFLKAQTLEYAPLYYAQKEQALAKGWTKSHAHNHAQRIVAKEFLRDLWEASAVRAKAKVGSAPPAPDQAAPSVEAVAGAHTAPPATSEAAA